MSRLVGEAAKDSNDGDDDAGSNDDEQFVNFGHTAAESDEHAITAIVRRYYAAAVAEDGVGGCAAMYPVIAETVVEDYEQVPGLRGGTCGAVMTNVFTQHHRQLAEEVAVLHVTRVRVSGAKGLAFVFLGKAPEPYLLVHRDGKAWKIESLSEVVLP